MIVSDFEEEEVLDGPYPGQAVWLLAHRGPHVKDHHIDLKLVAQKII